MSKNITIFFWISSLLFIILGLISSKVFFFDQFRIIPILILFYGLLILVFTYLTTKKNIRKTFPITINLFSICLFWSISIIVIIFSLEQFIREKNGFDLIDISLKTHLVPSALSPERDIKKIYNSLYAIENNLDANIDIFNPVDIFGVTTSSPPYLFKKNTKYSFIDGVLKPYEDSEKIHFNINSYGFRGNEINPDRKITILCLGASTTEGANSDENNTYPNILQELFNEEYSGVQILNLGHSGYTPNDSYNLLQFNLDLDPDIVIYFEGNGNGLAKTESYQDKGFSLSELYHQLYKRSLLVRAFFNAVPDVASMILFSDHPHTFNINNMATQEEYFFDVEKIINLAFEKNFIPVIVTPLNGWSDNIEFSTEEFLSMQNELYDYWPLTPKEIELFYIDYADKYKSLAFEKKVNLIDVENNFKDDKSLFLNVENKLNDLHHLSPYGNKRLAELIFEDLRILVDELN